MAFRRAALALFMMSVGGPALACEPEVEVLGGDIVVHQCSGPDKQITRGGVYADPVLSPDDRSIAYIKVEHQGTDSYGDSRTSLWIADMASGASRQLLASQPAGEMTTTLAAMWEPEFSLDGGFIYVESEAWVTSPAIHQVNVKTGTHRFVTAGALWQVVRTGKYRGYLLVQKHEYHPAPDYGSFNPVYIVRPDGKWSRLVPGSDKDDGENSVDAWLAKNAR